MNSSGGLRHHAITEDGCEILGSIRGLRASVWLSMYVICTFKRDFSETSEYARSIERIKKWLSLHFQQNGLVTNFVEKPAGDGYWVNGMP